MNIVVAKQKQAVYLLLTMLSISCFFWMLSAAPAQAGAYPRAIAHGCGAIQGNTVTNSREALEQAIDSGYQYIEVDMAFTTDGKIAMIHDWESSAGYYLGLGQNKAVSFAQYQQCSVMNKFTPLTMDQLAEILQKNPQVHIITDTKEDNVAILTAIQKQYPQLLKQIIPQIYQYEEYEPIKALGYEDIILTLYKMTNERNGARIAKFVQENDIFAVTMAYELADTGLAKTLQSYGIAVYMHTINTLQQTVNALNAGAYGIYTDTLLPQEVTYPGWQYYLAPSKNSKQQLSIELQQNGLQLNMRSSNKKGTVAYYIGDTLLVKGSINQILKADVDDIATGQHTITAKIYNGENQQVAAKNYLLWKDQSCMLLLAPQCQYILEQFSSLSDFSAALEGQSDALQQIARKSFFAKRGSAVYYNSGETGLYVSGNVLLPAIAADSQGNVYTSMYDTLLALGCSSTQMNNTTKAMEIKYKNKTYQAGITDVTKSYKKNIPVLKTKVQLYRNRAMANGPLYQELTGRQYVQQDGYLILLPVGTSVTEAQSQALLKIAKQLYQ